MGILETTDNAKFDTDETTSKKDDLNRRCTEAQYSSNPYICYQCTNISRPICKFRQI